MTALVIAGCVLFFGGLAGLAILACVGGTKLRRAQGLDYEQEAL